HYAWVNSKTLEIANITKQTENPPYGIIQKDMEGFPTGLLIESAMSLVTDEALELSKKRQQQLLDSFLRHSASLGVTSINDLYASRAMEKLADYEIFKEFDEKDRLTTRIHLYPAMD